jgi:hypothetical protein
VLELEQSRMLHKPFRYLDNAWRAVLTVNVIMLMVIFLDII